MERGLRNRNLGIKGLDNVSVDLKGHQKRDKDLGGLRGETNTALNVLCSFCYCYTHLFHAPRLGQSNKRFMFYNKKSSFERKIECHLLELRPKLCINL